ncbi:MAG: hypothetical protein IDH49_06415 [Gammaproteobacteria bacterium]|nr:hypothetical protein [Gammaproteobacteria bacterium]
MATPQKIQFISTSELHFDPENPRFYRLNDPTSVDAVIEEMFDDEGVQELMLSIGQKGYFEGEPLLISADENGKRIVVEGNRRLAATKLLNGEITPPKRRSTSVKLIRDEAQHIPPTELPCIAYPTRREVLRYLGYRHITGIKQWDSLSKARYLAQLRDEFYPDLEKPNQLKALSNDIGSKPEYVGKLLTALSLYQRAEDKKFFDLPIRAEDIEFSYLTTALNRKPIWVWLGLESPTDIEMPNLKADNLKSAFAWMFAKDQQGRTILGESRNLKELACIVESGDAIQVLKDTGRLSEAFLYTDGPQTALQTAMGQAGERIRVIWNMLPKTRPFSKAHADMAEELFDSIRDVRNHIREKMEEE